MSALPLVALQDPKVYVQALLDVHNKYSAMVRSSFNGDSGFIQSLDKVSVGSVLYLLQAFCRLHFKGLVVDVFPAIWCILPTSISQACGRFVNSNAVTHGPKASSRSPELLARYCDSLLKKRYICTCT